MHFYEIQLFEQSKYTKYMWGEDVDSYDLEHSVQATSVGVT